MYLVILILAALVSPNNLIIETAELGGIFLDVL